MNSIPNNIECVIRYYIFYYEVKLTFLNFMNFDVYRFMNFDMCIVSCNNHQNLDAEHLHHLAEFTCAVSLLITLGNY